MPFLEQRKIDDGLLLLWEMTESQEEIENFAKEFDVDPNYKKTAHPKRKREWLCVRKLLQVAACEHHQITYDENGKPLIDHQSFNSISISHSAKLAGVFLHPNEMAGLDIESVERNFSAIEKKFLSPAESALATQFTQGLALFWCIKEAAYKAAGLPGLVFNEQIQIEIDELGNLAVNVKRNGLMKFKIHRQMSAGQLIVCLTILRE